MSKISEAVKFEKLARKAIFAERFRKAYFSLCPDKQEFAALIGVSEQTIGEWLTGHNSPRYPESWQKLAAVLNVSEGWLRGYDVSMKRAAKKSLEIEGNLSYSQKCGEETVHVGIRIPKSMYEKMKETCASKNVSFIEFLQDLSQTVLLKSEKETRVICMRLSSGAIDMLEVMSKATGENISTCAANTLEAELKKIGRLLLVEQELQQKAE